MARFRKQRKVRHSARSRRKGGKRIKSYGVARGGIRL